MSETQSRFTHLDMAPATAPLTAPAAAAAPHPPPALNVVSIVVAAATSPTITGEAGQGWIRRANAETVQGCGLSH